MLFAAALPAFAQEAPATKYWFSDMVQDGQGTVWGLGAGLQFFDGKEWKTAPPPQFAAEDRAQALRLARLQDGSIACVWRLSRERIAVTRHTPAETRLMGMCEGRFESSNLRQPPYADSHGQLWLTDTGGDIYRMNKDGQLALAWSIKPGQLEDAGKEKPGRVAFIFAAEDGRGRVWMWSNSLDDGAMVSEPVLRGVLIYDQGKFTQQEHFEGITNNEISFIDRKDEKHMWVATLREGIFSVDIDTMKAEPLHEPEPNAFALAQKIFSSGDDLFVLTSGRFAVALWRLHGGKWSHLMDNIDGPGIATPCRQWLRAGDDTIIACYGADPLIMHGDGTPDRLDWRHGLTIGDARFFFQLPDGRMLAYGGDRDLFVGNVFLAPLAKLSRATELAFIHGWMTDADGNIWTVLSEKSGALSKWDGSQWHEYPLPEDKRGWGFAGVRIDIRGRVWLLPAFDSWTAFLDPHDGKWKEFENMQAAITELKNDSPQFAGIHRGLCLPDYSADLKRAAYRNNDNEIVYFDGRDWRRFQTPDIDRTSRNAGLVGEPFFDEAGRLCVSLGEQTWELDDQGHWQQSEVEAKYPFDLPGTLRPQKIAPPEGCVTNAPDSIAADNHGAFWLTWRGKLYKCGYGRCVEVFTKDEANPFADGRKIFDAWVDARGTAYLRTAADRRIRITPASLPPAAPSITLEKTGPDSVVARLQGGGKATVQFLARLDDGPWRNSNEPSVKFDGLANGRHVITAVAIDDSLQASAPASAKCEIQIDSKEQIAALIQALGDPDKREAASSALARQPHAALPALKAAREKADSGQLWWIDATIQDIDRAAAGGAGTKPASGN